MSDSGHFVFEGKLMGHRGWVTSIATPLDNSNKVLTASRDKTVVDWTRNPNRMSEDLSTEFAFPRKRLEGHSGIVEDVTLSSDAQFALTASWDCTLRLWELQSGQNRAVFRGHTKDVLSVAFSPDNRQIVSGGRDCKIKMWNSLGECKFTISEGAHTDWVTCVRFSPNPQSPYIVSSGCDGVVKLFTLTPFKHSTDLKGHSGYVSSVAVSPDSSLCASGGKDGVAMLWDLATGTQLYQLEANETIHSLAFSPNRYWLCAAVESGLIIWDLESKKEMAQLIPEMPALGKKTLKPECISLAWTADGTTLYSGYTDKSVQVFAVRDS